MYSVEYTKRFEKDVKRCVKRGLDISKLRATAAILAERVLYRTDTSHISYPEITQDVGNVILSLIGYSFGSKMITN